MKLRFAFTAMALVFFGVLSAFILIGNRIYADSNSDYITVSGSEPAAVNQAAIGVEYGTDAAGSDSPAAGAAALADASVLADAPVRGGAFLNSL